MNISVDKLLAKIDEELKLAKAATKEENLREKIYSIKILCELILDEKQLAVKPSAPIQPAVTQQVYQQPSINQQVFQQPSPFQQPKKIEMDDEANGDSLFDF
ncbi:YwdI family protein [Neobacillus cucumis]|uniref:YwdI family protein n=1 Tax=Neobacillus cucumis TaxID=1740721 RepID=UPI002852FB4B|nr:YwdI family protein [Neobacillus cucumis]MDR4950110.1 YwdI family protein [Neobacillus cucumis]